MNPVPLFLIIVTLPMLLGGCGEKATLNSVNHDELELREGIICLKGSDAPYTGKVFALWENGKRWWEKNYKDGKKDGLEAVWHSNGQKEAEVNFKDGKVIEGSLKYWNRKGAPVDSREEAQA